jgi:hypothetical protein
MSAPAAPAAASSSTAAVAAVGPAAVSLSLDAPIVPLDGDSLVVISQDANDWMNNASVQWRNFVYRTDMKSLDALGSERIGVHLDEFRALQAADAAKNHLTAPQSCVISVKDDIFLDANEMYSFLRHVLSPKATRGRFIFEDSHGKKWKMYSVTREPGLCPITTVMRFAKLDAYFGLRPGRFQFMYALRHRVSDEVGALEVLGLAEDYVDDKLWMRGAKLVADEGRVNPSVLNVLTHAQLLRCAGLWLKNSVGAAVGAARKKRKCTVSVDDWLAGLYDTTEDEDDDGHGDK